MKHIYLLLTENCNLRCPHCDVYKNGEDYFNKEKILEVITSEDCRVTLFGGEPLLYIDRLKFFAPYADSISSNLLLLDDERLEIIKELGVATSWTPARFTEKEFELWVNNVKRLPYKPLLLITLTPDLLQFKDFSLFKEFDSLFKEIKIEYVIDNNQPLTFYKEVEDYLLELYPWWKKNMTVKCHLFDDVEMKFDCRNQYTLYPNGELKHRCPHIEPFRFLIECAICEHNLNCRPCRLQKGCSYPKRLKELIKNNPC